MSELDRSDPALTGQHSGDRTAAQAEVDKGTDASLAQINSSFSEHRAKVVTQLLDRVVLVEPKLHRNFKPVVKAV